MSGKGARRDPETVVVIMIGRSAHLSSDGERKRERELKASPRGRHHPGRKGPKNKQTGILLTSELVDPASSDMLVSKIKPCTCQYEPSRERTR